MDGMTDKSDLTHQRWINYQNYLVTGLLAFLGWLSLDIEISKPTKILLAIIGVIIFLILFLFVNNKLTKIEK